LYHRIGYTNTLPALPGVTCQDPNMSTYFYGHHQQPQPQHHAIPTPHLPSTVSNHSGGRSRRNPRIAAQNPPRQFRGVKSMRELAEAPTVTAFRLRFEAGRSFDLDDDMEFCPNLLTEDDVRYPPWLMQQTPSSLIPTEAFRAKFPCAWMPV
jgi:hypothetical protein